MKQKTGHLFEIQPAGITVDIGIQPIAILGQLFHILDMLHTGAGIAISIDPAIFTELNPNKLMTYFIIGHARVMVKIKIMLQRLHLKYAICLIQYED